MSDEAPAVLGVGFVAVDCADPPALADFWAALLGGEVERFADGDVRLHPPGGPVLDFLLVPEAKTVKNRLHLDLRADGVATPDELERLLSLGARRVDIGQGPDVSWVVLGDPEGNEFCLLSRSVQEV